MYRRVGEDVYIVGGPGYSDESDAFVYLVDSATPMIIDSGLGNKTERILDNIFETGIDPDSIEYLALTHCHIDHTGGAIFLKNRLNLRLIAHSLDCAALFNGDPVLTAANWYNIDISPVEIDIVLNGDSGCLAEEREVFWYHIPGHTPGSIAIVYQSRDKKVIFGQDIHGPLMKEFKSDRKEYVRSLKRLIDLQGDILCEGHYGVIEGRKQIEKFIRQFL